MPKPLKILVSAYACSPYHGSEPGMGWNFIYRLSHNHEVHVITEKLKWKKEIEKEFDLHPELKENLKFYFIEKKRNKFLRKIWPLSYYWYYRTWQKKAYKLAVKLDEKENFDLIHQLNMVGFREPGYLWKIDKPFVWGPIGGTEILPWSFLTSIGAYGFIFNFGRNLINILHLNLLPRPKYAATRKRAKLISATPNTKKDIKYYYGIDSFIISEVGFVNNQLNFNIPKRKNNEVLKIIWVGLHIPRKGLNFLLKALSMISSLNFELHIFGEGPYTAKWKKLATTLNLSNKLYWYGWKSKDEVLRFLITGHLFCITSLLDLTSTVTLEALSSGLPVICPDHCGFSYVINDSCGVKVPINKPNQLIKDFSEAIKKVYENEEWRQQLAVGALKRASDFSWENKIEELNKIYYQLLSETN